MIVLITGMSATGKSTAVAGLRRAGFEAVDCDTDSWHGSPLTVEVPDGSSPSGTDHILPPEVFGALLAEPRTAPLFVCATHSNQQRFRAHFDHVVLFTAPTPVILQRLATRTGNDYGKDPAQRAEVLEYLDSVEPLLRRTADVVIDTGSTGPDQVVARLRSLVEDP